MNALLNEMPRDRITVSTVATRANVTPSTIYRRWGHIDSLLADVAVNRFHPESLPEDTGTLRGDLEAWAQAYQEEMSSAPGRAMIRDVLAGTDVGGGGPASQCAAIARAHIQILLDRATGRNDSAPGAYDVMDMVVAPIMYRMLFDDKPLDPTFAVSRVNILLSAM
ncbi:TetR-like C-terminal domain-containing protein [Paraburkholderia bengalensis]|uniref:TetR-like C-terminal domain-containing protein n=1 Tax=Paraburkholderia bengalensis TaxID=2747562 RepID=UPI00301450B3